MLTQVFEGKEFGYSIENETDVYLLFNPKYEITLPLKGDNAKRFGEHLEPLKSQNDDTSFPRIKQSRPATRRAALIFP